MFIVLFLADIMTKILTFEDIKYRTLLILIFHALFNIFIFFQLRNQYSGYKMQTSLWNVIPDILSANVTNFSLLLDLQSLIEV